MLFHGLALPRALNNGVADGRVVPAPRGVPRETLPCTSTILLKSPAQGPELTRPWFPLLILQVIRASRFLPPQVIPNGLSLVTLSQVICACVFSHLEGIVNREL